MDYSSIYNSLITSRTLLAVNGYSEKHHIIPRSMGGTDERANIIKLTARDHYFAHRLLAKIHGGGMWAALAYMSEGQVKSAKGVTIPSHVYALAKEKSAAWKAVKYLGDGNPFKGEVHSSETRKKMSGPRESIMGEKHPSYGARRPDHGCLILFVRDYQPRSVVTDLSVMRRIESTIMGQSVEIKKLGEHYRRKIAAIEKAKRRDITGTKNPNYGNGAAIAGEKNPCYGKPRSESTKAKIGAKSRRTLSCPHCGKVANIANAHRWHLDNCKQRSHAEAS